MVRYYSVDNRKLSFREMRNLSGSFLNLVILVVLKVLRIRFRFPAVPIPDSLSEMRIPETEVSATVMEGLRPFMCELEQAGFRKASFVRNTSVSSQVESTLVTYHSSCGEILVRAFYSINTQLNPPLVQNGAALITEFEDGSILCTSSMKATFNSPPFIEVNRLPGARIEQLIASHRQRMEVLRRARQPKRTGSDAEVEAFDERYERLCIEYQFKRGLYAPVDGEELAAEQAKAQVVSDARKSGMEGGEILAEMEALRNKKSGWVSGLIMILVSAAAFVGFGAAKWSWSVLLMLMPVLVFHEFGHYVAMRVFNYRNVRMLFIPGLGALMAGKNYNVAGWKQVIVSLMGPVPGLLLGGVLVMIGVILQQPWAISLGTMALILNGFNMLPIYPLDGGWVFHVLIFSRHPLLDAGVRAIACLALMWFWRGSGLMYFGIFLLMGIGSSYRVSRIAFELKKRQLPEPAPDSDVIPGDTAQAIIGEVKKAFPNLKHNRLLAQRALDVFEQMNARPPGWLASGGLLTIYFGSLVLAVLFAVIAVGQRMGGIANLVGARAGARISVNCESIQSRRAPKADVMAEQGHKTIVAEFRRADRAKSAYDELANVLPEGLAIERFGATVLVAVPANEMGLVKGWKDKLSKQKAKVYVDGTNAASSICFSFEAPDEQTAGEIKGELEAYFGAAFENLIAPWSPEDSRTPEERRKNLLARLTYLKLLSCGSGVYTNKMEEELLKKRELAEKDADDAAMKRIDEERMKLAEQLTQQDIQALRAAGENTFDKVVFDLYMGHRPMAIAALGDEDASKSRANRESPEEREHFRQLTVRMGAFDENAGSSAIRNRRFSTRNGIVIKNQREIQIQYLWFEDAFEGAPALVQWLCSKGCTNIKYSFQRLGNE